MTDQIHFAPLDPLQRYTVVEALAYLRISRNRLYQDINAGRLKILKDGKRTFIPGSEIIRRSRIDVKGGCS
jgi:hypothetical protein